MMTYYSCHITKSLTIPELKPDYSGIETSISRNWNLETFIISEIDLLFLRNNKLIPFEIKKTSMPTTSMIKSFNKIEGLSKEIAPGGIICFYDELIHLNEKHYIIPISSVINREK